MGTNNPGGFNNPVLIANGGTSGATATAAFDALSPLTTKGDLIAYSSTNIRLAAGTNTYGLICDSTAATGIAWNFSPSVTSVAITSTSLTLTGSAVTTTGTYTVDLPASVVGNNLLLNGGMELYMRKTSGSTGSSGVIGASTTVYTLDRWQCQVGASSSITVTQQQASGAGLLGGANAARIQRSNANTNTNPVYFAQSLTRDMCIGAAGNIVTFSFRAKCGANYSPTSSLLGIVVYSGTGTTDVSGINNVFSGSAAVINTSVTLTTSYQTFTASSTALGSTVTQLCAQFTYTPVGTAGAADTFFITDVKLEISPQFTGYLPSTEYQVYADCARFYQKSSTPVTAPAVSGSVAQAAAWTASQAAALSDPSPTFIFPITMRATPTIRLFNPGAAGAQAFDNTGSVSCSATASVATPQGISFTCTGNAATVTGNALLLTFDADAEIT